MKKTIEEINLMKGILVLLVMSHHLWTPIYNTYFSMFFAFTMPLFFFLSGYFMKGLPLKEQLLKRLKAIGKPFLIYYLSLTVIGGVILHFTQGLTLTDWLRSVGSESLGEGLMNSISPGLSLQTPIHQLVRVMWFFLQLLLATLLLTPLLAWAKDSLKVKCCMSAVCLMISGVLYSAFGILPFQIQMLFFEAGIMMLGNIAHDCNIFTEERVKDIPSKLLIIALGIGITYLIDSSNPGCLWMGRGKIGSYNNMTDVITATALTIAGAVAFYELCSILKKLPRIKKGLNYIGTHSLDYIFVHIPIACLFSLIFAPHVMDYTLRYEDYDGSLSQIALLALFFLGNILLCTAYSKVLSLIKSKKILSKEKAR